MFPIGKEVPEVLERQPLEARGLAGSEYPSPSH